MFGSIFGFAILKPLSKALPERFGGGYFGPKENVCCQSAATAAGSLGLLFTSGFPAAYQLGLLGANPSADFGRLITFTICCAYVGIFFTMPLRRLYILKLKLTFPSSVATAYTIRSLHVGRAAAATARKKTWALVASFLASICWRVTSEYAPGIMWDWHWSWWFYRAGWKWIICAESWGWVWEWTPAFIGCGLLVPMNSSASFVGGAVLAWAIIGPALVATGRAFGTPMSPLYPGYLDYSNMDLPDPVHQPSPEYWMIWPGCMLLLTSSVAEILANYKTIVTAFSVLLEPLITKVRRLAQLGERDVHFEKEDGFYDPVPPEEQTPWWMWTGGLVASTVLTMLVMKFQFDQNPGLTLLAVIFAFIFSLVGAECVGRVSVNPVTTLGNFSQLIFGGISKGSGLAPQRNQLNNGLTGMITLAAAEQCSDMLGDLKATHLLGASPRVQLYSQCCGALVSIFLSTAMYVVFSKAYPCINTLSSSACEFAVPDVKSWRAVSIAVSSSSLPIPTSSGITALVFMVMVLLSTAAKYRWVPPAHQHWVPNWNAVGIAFVLGPTNTYPVAMMFGSVIAFVWRRRWPNMWFLFGYAIAAGMIAGEGLGGIVNAVLQIGKVSGNLYGTAVGCPMNAYCG
ncbi:OPT oligopeptide transporter [Fomitopsis schrenkii]|uniref:OPT oligopeptide transporter n=1 Tax=Fomitopsis schrenkii TaxID=2126942 RepID=S8E7X7_FOMSC|nr:OPT oligopeptide transporter [Fomitopsis schrenkii]